MLRLSGFELYSRWVPLITFISKALSYFSAPGSSRKSRITYIPVVKFYFEIRCTCTLKLLTNKIVSFFFFRAAQVSVRKTLDAEMTHGTKNVKFHSQ